MSFGPAARAGDLDALRGESAQRGQIEGVGAVVDAEVPVRVGPGLAPRPAAAEHHPDHAPTPAGRSAICAIFHSADSMQVLRRLRALYERLAWLCDAGQRDALSVRLEAMDRHAASAHWTQPLDRALVRRPDARGLGSELGTDLS